MVKCAYFSDGFDVLETKQKQTKSGVFSKARSGDQGTIFRLLGILLKIADGRNGERCILLKGV